MDIIRVPGMNIGLFLFRKFLLPTPYWSLKFRIHNITHKLVQVGLIDRLQSVQNKFLRYLHWREPDRPLNLLRLHPLVVRREVADVVFLYKILNFVVVCPPLLERIAFRLPSGTRSRCLFELSHLNRNYLQFSSVPRMLRLGNEVCSEVDFFCNRLGALRRAVLTVRLEAFESE
ncbi:hypothetical protein J6590_071038 [Homalodisca vitripennis]|nr:hypothetical protein J6590_071038 [Homalodisca vitripennis]